MALSRNEIQAKSDAKRGVKLKGFKFYTDTIALLEAVAAHAGASQTQVLTQALQEYADKHGIALPPESV